MTKNILILATVLSLLSTPALALPGAGPVGAWTERDQGAAEQPLATAYSGDAPGEMYAARPDQDRQRLAGDEEDVAKDKDALSRDRQAFRWWLLDNDKRHLEEDQSTLSQDYEVYAHDSRDGGGTDADPGALRSPE